MTYILYSSLDVESQLPCRSSLLHMHDSPVFFPPLLLLPNRVINKYCTAYPYIYFSTQHIQLQLSTKETPPPHTHISYFHLSKIISTKINGTFQTNKGGILGKLSHMKRISIYYTTKYWFCWLTHSSKKNPENIYISCKILRNEE